MGKKAVFLDRDGTIIKDKHYLADPDQVEFFPDSFEALKLLRQKSFHLFLVTNQSGIGRGYFQLDAMEKVHDRILKDLAAEGIVIDDIAFCPHSPEDNCSCRKPLPNLINQLSKKHGIDGESYMVGDKDIDAQAGKNAGIIGVLLSQNPDQEFPTFKNLLEFAQSLD